MLLSLVGVLALTLAGWWLSRSSLIGRQLGTTMVVLIIGFLVTNVTGWQPDEAAGSWVTGPLTSLAITQLLLAVDLRRIGPEAKRLFSPFVVAVVSTLFAVLLGAVLLQPVVHAAPEAEGEEAEARVRHGPVRNLLQGHGLSSGLWTALQKEGKRIEIVVVLNNVCQVGPAFAVFLLVTQL